MALTCVHELGRGTYGVVYEAYDESHRKFAVKITDTAKRKLGWNEWHPDRDLSIIAYTELRMLQRFRYHPNIVHLEGYSVQDKSICLVLTWYSSTLTKLIGSYQTCVSFHNIKLTMNGIFSLLVDVHRARVIHRDLKPDNILIDEQRGARVGDWGMSVGMKQGETTVPYTDTVTTSWYRAPEVVQRKAYGTAVDMWAAGCILVELMRKTPAFPCRDDTQLPHMFQLWNTRRALQDREALYKEHFGPLCDLVGACLEQDPAKRISAERALNFLLNIR